jgi:hypothetical protein
VPGCAGAAACCAKTLVVPVKQRHTTRKSADLIVTILRTRLFMGTWDQVAAELAGLAPVVGEPGKELLLRPRPRRADPTEAAAGRGSS